MTYEQWLKGRIKYWENEREVLKQDVEFGYITSDQYEEMKETIRFNLSSYIHCLKCIFPQYDHLTDNYLKKMLSYPPSESEHI